MAYAEAQWKKRLSPQSSALVVLQGSVQLPRKVIASLLRDPSSLRLLVTAPPGGGNDQAAIETAVSGTAESAAVSLLLGGLSLDRLIWDLERSSAVVSPAEPCARNLGGICLLLRHIVWSARSSCFDSTQMQRARQSIRPSGSGAPFWTGPHLLPAHRRRARCGRRCF